MKSRPNTGATPKVEKKLGVTMALKTAFGSPFPVKVKASEAEPASAWKLLAVRVQSR